MNGSTLTIETQQQTDRAMTHPTVRLIAIDVDGTLLDSAHTLSPGNRQALQAALAAGCHVTLATGRQYTYIAPLVTGLGLHSPQITSSGAVITLPASGEMLYADRIAREVAAQAIQLGEQLGITLVVIQNGKSFARAINADIEHMLTYGDPQPHVVPDLTATLHLPPTNIKAIAYRRDDLYARAEVEFQRDLGAQLNIFRSVPYYLEFSAKSVSKGTALRRVAERLGIEQAAILAIGDGNNDLAMFEVAGTAVAMGNASDAVKACADAVTGHCDADGVAQALERFVLRSE